MNPSNHFSNRALFLSMAASFTASISLVSPQMASAQVKPSPVLETSHTLTTGTYLGGSGDDEARAVVLSVTGDPIVAGNFATLQTPGAILEPPQP